MNPKAMNEIFLTLPIPPSVNAAYAGTVRRHKSEKYSAWIQEAHVANMKNKKFKITEDKWLSVEYTYFMNIYTKSGKKKIIDVFNYEKCLSDVLSGHKKKGIFMQPPLIPGFEDHKILEGHVKKVHSDRNEVEISIIEHPDVV